MLGRLAVSAFALWMGYNAIQMFSCESVTWSGGRPTCWEGTGFGTPQGMSGQSTGVLILTAVIALLLYLWVWPLMRSRTASQIPASASDPMMSQVAQNASASSEALNRIKEANPKIEEAFEIYRTAPMAP
jgi:hypothetical protein